MKNRFRDILAVILLVLLPLPLLWCLGVLHFLVFPENTFLTVSAGVLLFLLWLSGWFCRRAVPAAVIALLGIAAFFFSVTPSQRFAGTRWRTPWGRRPGAGFPGQGRILFRDVRDFRYRTENDYTVRYRDMTVDPARLRSVDLAVSHWDGLEAVAHTMLGFNFSDGRTLVLSMETRIPEGQEQSAVAGLFKQYEILPVLGTPEDVFDLRIKYRGEDFYLYRTCADPEQARMLLMYVARKLNGRREFYNTLTRNCSTSLVPLVEAAGLAPDLDIRLLFNGYSDRMLFQLGYLKHREGESFDSLRNRSYVPGLSRGR
ncbi:MAG: DUF4105 domain-containing protein [Lentisphaeria bacterium]|nr:DUF4105 domain-containing protein [Lentisphaeria bacterium]